MRCRLCLKPADGEWCDSCAHRMHLKRRTCLGCKKPFYQRQSRQVYCSGACRTIEDTLSRSRMADYDDDVPDIPETEIERRYQAHMAYLKATRKHSVDPFAQRKDAAVHD